MGIEIGGLFGLVILLLPVVGFLLWLLLGPKGGARV